MFIPIMQRAKQGEIVAQFFCHLVRGLIGTSNQLYQSNIYKICLIRIKNIYYQVTLIGM